MKRVYISSTKQDLAEYRQAVSDTLRSCGYDVDWMEAYHARDDEPKTACEADVARSDYYVGIFAWRYGHVPDRDNPERKSVTELEYLAACGAGKPRFVFLLDDAAPWPSSHRDAEQQPDEGKRIRELRNRLKTERWAGFFTSADSLARKVLVSLAQYENTKRSESVKALDEIQSAPDLGPSFLSNIGARLEALESVQFVSICLGPTPWWNTRLHLAAALASDFTDIQQFALFNAAGGFELIAPPVEVRRALAKAWPKLEIAYQTARDRPGGPPSPIDSVLMMYGQVCVEVFQRPESEVKEVLSATRIRELGIRSRGEVVEKSDRQENLPADIVRRRVQFVVLMRDGKLDGIVDRVQLASRLAELALA